MPQLKHTCQNDTLLLLSNFLSVKSTVLITGREALELLAWKICRTMARRISHVLQQYGKLRASPNSTLSLSLGQPGETEAFHASSHVWTDRIVYLLQ